ncbi:MAG: hypothetical protein ACLGG7_06610 [Bacteriovoracia bacterium]
MRSQYSRQLTQLSGLARHSGPKVSIFLPLTKLLVSEQKILSGLVATANRLIGSGGPRLVVSLNNVERWRMQGAATLAIYCCGIERIIVPLPFPMEPRVIVADSFHVKPLVAAYQNYTETVLVHFHHWGATLYRVSETEAEKIDTYLPPGPETEGLWHDTIGADGLRNFVAFIQQQLIVHCGQYTSMLAVTGHGVDLLQSRGLWKSVGVPVLFMEDSWNTLVPERSLVAIRRMVAQQIERLHAKDVSAVVEKSTVTSYDELVRRIHAREIATLIVSLDDLQFGRVDPQTGKAHLSKQQMSATDDDVLDDLLELAIKKGIRVRVIPRTHLPAGVSFLAA